MSSESAPEQQRADAWLRRLPSPLWILVLALGGVLVGITVTKGVQDPDFFWHVTTGQLIAETGRVPAVDPFSFTWAGQPWTPHEWLSELLIYWLTSALGRTGALLVFGLFPAAIVATQAAMLSRRGVRAAAFALPAVLIGLVITPYVTLRPQAVSWLLLSVLVWFLMELRPDRPRRALWLIPFFVLWANLHGVYVIGLGAVATYCLFTIFGRTPMSQAKGWMAAAAIGAVLASMATPAGPVGILYPLRYIELSDWGLANIQEWQSPSFHEPAHWAFLALIVAVGLNGGRATPGWLVTLSWVGIALGLVALRNVPIAAVFGLPALALGLESRLRERDARRDPSRPMKPTLALGRRLLELGAAVVVVVGSLAVLVPPGVGDGVAANIRKRFPVPAVELLQQVAPDARVLAEYGWGGYVIHELYPTGGRVFVDGRNDMYDQRILDDYDAIKMADPDWEEIADRYGVEAILLMPTATLTRGPAETAGWCEAYRDETQVLYLRACPTDG
jgi:uncharacterized membrane protein